MRGWLYGLVMLMSTVPGAAECAERRVALIVGNDAYVKIGALHNAANDARRMDQALRAAGFDTTVKIDAKRRSLYAAIDAFAAQIAASPETVGLFYYAGHGIQANGNNYLIPVDADIDSESDLEAEAVDAGKVLRAMGEAHNRLNIVVLDACRDNPLPKKSRSASRGLARMDAPTGTFIAYAAGPGQTAQDGGAGGNGVFTGELVKAMTQPGLPIEQVFKRAAAGVRADTGDKQVPWTEASLQGDFFFHAAGSAPVVAAVAAPAAAPGPAGTDPGAFELAYWNSVKDSRNPAEIKSYLDKYPRGNFSGLAKVKYDELRAVEHPSSQEAPTKVAMATPLAVPAAPAAASNPAGHDYLPPNGFADEMRDFGVPPQPFLQYNVGTATPTSIPGARVIATQALAGAYRSAVLIDAWNDRTHGTLPGAIRMWAAGSPGNYNDRIQADFRAALAYRSGNNLQKPLVFFCAGVSCWESYNAALRAVQMGYREVYWYRGGVAAWQAAGLPLVPP